MFAPPDPEAFPTPTQPDTSTYIIRQCQYKNIQNTVVFNISQQDVQLNVTHTSAELQTQDFLVFPCEGLIVSRRNKILFVGIFPFFSRLKNIRGNKKQNNIFSYFLLKVDIS